ncbi:hypothetical protein [Sulfuriroseicoccus oceanibius]|uniref:Uncharacterized protein n=1 Tax=Sulfuriroseicoccus oceanibius TaxID=2707525 RepID=A0A6B3LE05_9BACT|nr:hypothetical protein [Sulfuriroseicoccus oceanibius]QQL44747.1 hypothetical protein G3M56_012835 [Sulfuriroseicoccus oceanibius]
MKATINNDPIARRQLRGRRIARGVSLAALAIFGLTAWIKPELFSNELDMPTAEEREKARQERKNQSQKRPRVLSKEDIERLANKRKERYRKQLIESITKLEERVTVAEQMEAEATELFRNDPNTLPSLKTLIPDQIKGAKGSLMEEYRVGNQDMNAFITPDWQQVDRCFGVLFNGMSQWETTPNLQPMADAAEKLHSTVKGMSWKTDKGDDGFTVATKRQARTLAGNTMALATNNVDLALRGNASAEDHPLTQPQRADLAATLSPMNIAQLHELSQKLGAHYSDLMGDVQAAKLAEVANITFPEAIEKIAHESYVQDDLSKELNGIEGQMPLTDEQLEALSALLQEAAASAARALTSSTPAKEGGT